MAKRYSGDVEIRMTVRPYRGWDGKVAPFYFASISAPGHRARAILSPREVGLSKGEDPRTPASYDKAAVAFLRFAHQKSGIGRFASIEGDKLNMLRVQQAPCPVVERDPSPRKKKR